MKALFVIVLFELFYVTVLGDIYNVACPLEGSYLPAIMHSKKFLNVEECAMSCFTTGAVGFSFNTSDNICILYSQNLEESSYYACNHQQNVKYFNRNIVSKCQKDWYPYAAKCFYRSNKTLSWEMANKRCIGLGGNLATIQGNSTNTFVLDLLDPFLDYWLGGNDLNGAWMWKSNNEPFSFTYWGSGQPNNVLGRQHCLAFTYSHQDKAMKWNDKLCLKQYNFICEVTL